MSKFKKFLSEGLFGDEVIEIQFNNYGDGTVSADMLRRWEPIRVKYPQPWDRFENLNKEQRQQSLKIMKDIHDKYDKEFEAVGKNIEKYFEALYVLLEAETIKITKKMDEELEKMAKELSK